MFVPVLDQDNNPLMPTKPSRARRWIKNGEATPFWKHGVFCIRLNRRPSDNKKEDIVIGIDPGSKKEGFTIKSESHTYLNIQADAVTHVKKSIWIRKNARHARRQRNTPCRKHKKNRVTGQLSPSTKSRWQFKLSIINWLRKMFPISHVIVEDISARTKKGNKQWNITFSPLQVGKKWFYEKIKSTKLKLSKIKGYDTKKLRDDHGLEKSKNKMAEDFSSHCVDSWVMANSIVGGHIKPDNTSIILISPLFYHRRQLHVFQPSKNGIRKKYGGTRSLCFKRGSLIKHKKHDFCIVGGNSKERISVHKINTNKRFAANVRIEDCKFLTYLRFYMKGE